jgi:DNA-binding LytR/AlgR family response regulator
LSTTLYYIVYPLSEGDNTNIICKPVHILIVDDEENIHFLLMDFKMSGMNGLETFKEIRKMDLSSKAPFITAHYDESLC